MEKLSINNITGNNLKLSKPSNIMNYKKGPNFCADKKQTTCTNETSIIKKGIILTAAVLILSLPVALSKLPLTRFKALHSMQEKLNHVLKNSVKPFIDKLMGRNTLPNSGLNVIR